MTGNSILIAFSALTGGISAVSTIYSVITRDALKPKEIIGRCVIVAISVVVIAYVFVTPAKPSKQTLNIPETATTHYQRSKQYFFDHNRPMAIKEAKQAVEIEPTHEEAHKLLGACYGIDQNMDAAAAEYKEAADINPDDLEAQLGLATAEEALGE